MKPRNCTAPGCPNQAPLVPAGNKRRMTCSDECLAVVKSLNARDRNQDLGNPNPPRKASDWQRWAAAAERERNAGVGYTERLAKLWRCSPGTVKYRLTRLRQYGYLSHPDRPQQQLGEWCRKNRHRLADVGVYEYGQGKVTCRGCIVENKARYYAAKVSA